VRQPFATVWPEGVGFRGDTFLDSVGSNHYLLRGNLAIGIGAASGSSNDISWINLRGWSQYDTDLRPLIKQAPGGGYYAIVDQGFDGLTGRTLGLYGPGLPASGAALGPDITYKYWHVRLRNDGTPDVLTLNGPRRQTDGDIATLWRHAFSSTSGWSHTQIGTVAVLNWPAVSADDGAGVTHLVVQNGQTLNLVTVADNAVTTTRYDLSSLGNTFWAGSIALDGHGNTYTSLQTRGGGLIVRLAPNGQWGQVAVNGAPWAVAPNGNVQYVSGTNSITTVHCGG
jgi:hypothetical protein